MINNFETMEKVKIKDIKTGRVLEVTSNAWNTIRRTGGLKKYDLLTQSKASTKPATPKKATPKKEEPKETSVPKVDTNDDGKRSATEVIAAIEKAKSKKAVDVLIDGESRKTVLKAAQKRKSQL